MNKVAWFCIFSVFSSASLAVSSYTGNDTNGTLVVQDIDVNGVPIFDSASMELDLKNGTFKIVTLQTKNSTVFTTPIESVSKEGFDIGLLGCARSSGTNDITCYIQIVNTLLDRDLTINGDTAIAPSLITDDQGATYKPVFIRYNNKEQPYTFNLTLSQGVPTKIQIGYKAIDVRAKSLSSFLPGFSLGSTSFNVQYNNIKF